MPAPCSALATVSSFAPASNSLVSCTNSLKLAPVTAGPWTSCIPSRFLQTNTASTIYSCLKTIGLECSYNTDCSTGIFPVGAEPTTPPRPASTVAITNGGFENGNFSGWTITQPLGPFNTQDVSTVRARNGSYAARGISLNDNGHSTTLAQVVFLEPGANYTISGWISQENPLSNFCHFGVYAFPYVTRVYVPLPNLMSIPAGTWYQFTSTFQAATSVGTIFANFGCDVTQPVGSEVGKNTLYMDDITLVRN